MQRRAYTVLAVWFLLLAPLKGVQAQGPASDPFAGDERLASRHTFSVRGQPLDSLLIDLSRQTGVRLVADVTVAQDKVTLFANRRPLPDTLRALATFFGFSWRREDGPTAPAYVLFQSRLALDAEKQSLNARLYRITDQILQEIALGKRIAQWKPEDLAAREAKVREERLGEKDPVKRQTLYTEWLVLANYRANTLLPVAMRFLEGLSREQIVRMLDGEAKTYTWPPTLNQESLPQSVVDDIKRVLVGNRQSPPETETFSVSLSFRAGSGRLPRLTYRAQCSWRTAGMASGSTGHSAILPLNPFMDQGVEEQAVAPPDWESHPFLFGRVDLDLTAWSGGNAARKAALRPPALTEALDSLEANRPTDLIADGFWSGRRTPLSLNNKPLGEALTAIGSAYNHRWWVQDGFVMMKSLYYASDRIAEPPFASMFRWAEMLRQEEMTVEDLAEVAALPDMQYETVIETFREAGYGPLFESLGTGRSHLVFWKTLAPDQRARARKGGLPYPALTPEQQKLFIQASEDRLSPYRLYQPEPASSWTPQKLEQAVFRVELDDKELKRLSVPTANPNTPGDADPLALNIPVFVDKPNGPKVQFDQPPYVTLRFLYTSRDGWTQSGYFPFRMQWKKTGMP